MTAATPASDALISPEQLRDAMKTQGRPTFEGDPVWEACLIQCVEEAKRLALPLAAHQLYVLPEPRLAVHAHGKLVSKSVPAVTIAGLQYLAALKGIRMGTIQVSGNSDDLHVTAKVFIPLPDGQYQPVAATASWQDWGLRDVSLAGKVENPDMVGPTKGFVEPPEKVLSTIARGLAIKAALGAEYAQTHTVVDETEREGFRNLHLIEVRRSELREEMVQRSGIAHVG